MYLNLTKMQKTIWHDGIARLHWVNTLAPGRPGCHFKTAIFNLVLLIGLFRSSNNNAPKWMPWELTKDKSTLVQVMAWCLQATSHYLSQCWPSSMSPYASPGHNVLTHLGWNKMAAISQMTFPIAFSLMKMHEFRLKFHWSLFLIVQLITIQHWFR